MPLSASFQQLKETWDSFKADLRTVREDCQEEYPSLAATASKVQSWVLEYADLIFLANVLTAVWWAPWHVAIGAMGGVIASSLGGFSVRDENHRTVFEFGDFMKSPAAQGWWSMALLISRTVLKRGIAAFATGYFAADFVVCEARRLTWQRSG